jgi:N-sulfoglucosamine sulfohydrolase
MPRIVLLLLLIHFIAIATSSDAAQPNIVWIIADDMSPDIAAYGAAGVKTPNLDRLAKEGRRYTRAYATAPVCSSSRSAFILGCYQTTTGLHAHDVENPQPLAAPYVPLPTILRDAGWYVTNAAAPGSNRSGRPIAKGKTHYNFAHDPAVMFDGDDWRNRKSDQPFFAQFQISEPHRPFPIPSRFDETQLAAIALPANYPEHPLVRRDWYAYQRSVEVVDQRVGAIIDQLQAEGVLDNTIVMFFADHGRPMPWGKQWLSVEGLHVPLITRGPGIEQGSVVDTIVSLIDIAPSILRRADLPVPTWMEGEAILDAKVASRSQIFAARDRCGDADDRIRAVITADYLFVRNFHPKLSRFNWSSYKEEQYPGVPLMRTMIGSKLLSKPLSDCLLPERPEFELYRLSSDPQGMDNIVDDPAQRNTVIGMKQILDAWITTSGDRGALPAVATEPSLSEIQAAKRAGYQRTWMKRLGKSEPTDDERVKWWEQLYGLLH